MAENTNEIFGVVEACQLNVPGACRVLPSEHADVKYWKTTMRDWWPLQKGDLYFTPDGTVFIRGQMTIPETFEGEEIIYE